MRQQSSYTVAVEGRDDRHYPTYEECIAYLDRLACSDPYPPFVILEHADGWTTVIQVNSPNPERGEWTDRGEVNRKDERDPVGVAPMNADDIRALRESLSLSQAEFASRYHIDKQTLQSWEAGRREPTRIAQTLLRLIRAHPQTIAAMLARLKTPAQTRSVAQARRRDPNNEP
jgi:DNA-binding transcriptional regulator YiaG